VKLPSGWALATSGAASDPTATAAAARRRRIGRRPMTSRVRLVGVPGWTAPWRWCDVPPRSRPIARLHSAR